jgi:oligosaccharide repeat unit polymerase
MSGFPLHLLTLFLLLFGLVAFTLFVGKGRSFLPSLVVEGMFLLVSAVCLVYSAAHALDVAWTTVFFFYLLVLAFFLADWLFRMFFRSFFHHSDKAPSSFSAPHEVRLRWWVLLLVLAFFSAIAAWQGLSIIRQVRARYGAAAIAGWLDYLTKARLMATSNLLDTPYLLSQLLALEKALSFVLGFLFVSNVVFYGFKWRDLLFLLPLPLYVLSIILTTGRTELIYLFCVVFFSFLFAMGKKYAHAPKGKLRTGAVSLVGIALFALAFLLLGSIRKSSTSNDGFTASVYKYLGEPISLLDYFFAHSSAKNTLFGEHTLYSLYGFLHALGIPVAALPNSHLEGYYIGGVLSNVYSLFVRWVMDYGYVGTIGLTFFWGLVYSFFVSYEEERKSFGFYELLVSWLFYPLVLIAIEDGFIATYSLSFFYFVIYLALFYYLFVGRKRGCFYDPEGGRQPLAVA